MEAEEEEEDNLEDLAHLDLKDLLVMMLNLVTTEHLECQAQLVREVLKVTKAMLVQEVCQELVDKDHPVFKDHKDHADPQDHRDRLAEERRKENQRNCRREKVPNRKT